MAGGTAYGAASGLVTGGPFAPITVPTEAAGGALVGGFGGSAIGAGVGFAPGCAKGYGEGYGPGAAVGGGHGAGPDDTWLGKKLDSMIHGHDAADKKADGDHTKCGGHCLPNTPADVLKGKTKGKTLEDGTDQYIKDEIGEIDENQKDFNSLNP